MKKFKNKKTSIFIPVFLVLGSITYYLRLYHESFSISIDVLQLVIHFLRFYYRIIMYLKNLT